MFGLAVPALGAGQIPPWTGGAAQMAPFEARASEIASTLAGRDAWVVCVNGSGWIELANRYGFAKAETWALTPMNGDTPGDVTKLSPRACAGADAFFRRPVAGGTRICRHGTLTGECDGWGRTLVAVHVLAHESMHLAGIVDEAEADCLGLQLDAFVAMRLGAPSALARQLATDYWTQYYPEQPPGYRSPRCHDGGALDAPNRIATRAPSCRPRQSASASSRTPARCIDSCART